MENFISVRVTEDHKRRMAELCQATGLPQSIVVRRLIENARLELLPMPTTTIHVKDNSGVIRQDKHAAAVSS